MRAWATRSRKERRSAISLFLAFRQLRGASHSQALSHTERGAATSIEQRCMVTSLNTIKAHQATKYKGKK